MNNFNFTGVEVAQENTGSGFVQVNPGYQKLTISSVEDVTSSAGNLGLKLTFESDKGGSFNQSFWIAKPSGEMLKSAPSFQYLVEKFSGTPLAGTENTAAISAKLVGKTLDVTVGGRRHTTEKDGKKYNNTYAWLPFAGYAGETTIAYDKSSNWDETPTEESAPMGGDSGFPF